MNTGNGQRIIQILDFSQNGGFQKNFFFVKLITLQINLKI